MNELNLAAQALVTHPLFGLGLTLAAYQLAMYGYERTGLTFLQPVLSATLLIIAVLVGLGLSFEHYQGSIAFFTLLLGPTTVALAVPLYMNLKRIRRMLGPVLLMLLFGGVVATAAGIGLAHLFQIEHSVLLSLAPKSATSPIAMLVAEKMGGVASLAAVFVLINGILGGMFGVELLRRFGIVHPAAVGLALGIVAHAVGTARALQEGEECAAFAALGMSLMGIGVALLLPLAFYGLT